MNKKILKWNQKISLVLNYKEVIKCNLLKNNLIYPILDELIFKKIEKILTGDKVDNFNLSLEFRSDNINYNYKEDWYTCKFIFHGEDDIKIVFDNLSNYSDLTETDFNFYFKNKPIVDENHMEISIINLIDLKELLIDNRSKLLNQLKKFKK